ncbi:MAG: Si-specific NAD(P)(+) transhydrogenase [Deltaproteobacteria bacterium]|nr:Si-specific NAD(P)(+) transhydrogenase [Deltaproteobacteria bacterium]
MRKFDVLVIGTGPGGQKAAIQASKLGKSVAVIEKNPFLGGAGLHTGTLPSKTLRETAVFLSGFKQRAVFGYQFAPGRELTLSELMYRKTEVIRKQMGVIIEQFSRNNVEIIYGDAAFTGQGRLAVTDGGGKIEKLSASVIIIATGSMPARPADVPFDKDHIYDSDSILGIENLPLSLTIIGGGVIGCEYACVFAALGIKITLVEKKKRLLTFADEEIVSSLVYWMRQSGITLRLDEEVVSIRVEAEGKEDVAPDVVTKLKSGKVITSEKLLYTMGRVGNTGGLNLSAIGVKTDDRGHILVNENFQTQAPQVYAIGDCIGFPSLASTSMEQGRRAVCHAFLVSGITCDVPLGAMPYAIYTIPEISMVGENEEGLTAQGIPYEVGCAFFKEVARGQIIGDTHGMIKLLFHRESRKLLGVHIIGEKASELIHIGHAVLNFGGSVDYFKDVVFNYPTLSDAYKEAAMNGLNKL